MQFRSKMCTFRSLTNRKSLIFRKGGGGIAYFDAQEFHPFCIQMDLGKYNQAYKNNSFDFLLNNLLFYLFPEVGL